MLDSNFSACTIVIVTLSYLHACDIALLCDTFMFLDEFSIKFSEAAFTYLLRFDIDTVSRFRKPHQNRCGLKVFAQNSFRTVCAMLKSSQTKGMWVRKNLLCCFSHHSEKYISVHNVVVLLKE